MGRQSKASRRKASRRKVSRRGRESRRRRRSTKQKGGVKPFYKSGDQIFGCGRLGMKIIGAIKALFNKLPLKPLKPKALEHEIIKVINDELNTGSNVDTEVPPPPYQHAVNNILINESNEYIVTRKTGGNLTISMMDFPRDGTAYRLFPDSLSPQYLSIPNGVKVYKQGEEVKLNELDDGDSAVLIAVEVSIGGKQNDAHADAIKPVSVWVQGWVNPIHLIKKSKTTPIIITGTHKQQAIMGLTDRELGWYDPRKAATPAIRPRLPK